MTVRRSSRRISAEAPGTLAALRRAESTLGTSWKTLPRAATGASARCISSKVASQASCNSATRVRISGSDKGSLEALPPPLRRDEGLSPETARLDYGRWSSGLGTREGSLHVSHGSHSIQGSG